MKKLLTLVLASILTGCVATQSGIMRDKYTGKTFVQSDYIVGLNSSLMSGANGRLFYSNGAYALKVTYMGYDWLFLDSATVMGGEKLTVKELDRRVTNGGIIEEDVQLTLTKQHLETALNSKLMVRIEGKRGNVEIELTRPMVQKFVNDVASFDDPYTVQVETHCDDSNASYHTKLKCKDINAKPHGGSQPFDEAKAVDCKWNNGYIAKLLKDDCINSGGAPQ